MRIRVVMVLGYRDGIRKDHGRERVQERWLPLSKRHGVRIAGVAEQVLLGGAGGDSEAAERKAFCSERHPDGIGEEAAGHRLPSAGGRLPVQGACRARVIIKAESDA